MIRLNVDFIRSHFADVLSRVRGGQSVEVVRRGRPVAIIVPVPAAPAKVTP